jgi:hypothetical protein
MQGKRPSRECETPPPSHTGVRSRHLCVDGLLVPQRVPPRAPGQEGELLQPAGLLAPDEELPQRAPREEAPFAVQLLQVGLEVGWGVEGREKAS